VLGARVRAVALGSGMGPNRPLSSWWTGIGTIVGTSLREEAATGRYSLRKVRWDGGRWEDSWHSWTNLDLEESGLDIMLEMLDG